MEEFKLRAKVIEANTLNFINECEKEQLTNEQWFIEWEMKMSEYVTKDHNKKI